MKSRGKVLIAAPVHAVLTDGLTEQGYECVVQEKIQQSVAAALLADCVGVITSTRLQLDKGLIDAAPNLRWIGRMGSGMEVIDTIYATEQNIACFSSPEGNCNAVGEFALGMLLSLTRNIAVSRNEVQAGQWLREENRGYELEGKTVGIIGYGHTGPAFAKKLSGFDVNILVYDKYRQHIPVDDQVTICADLTQIYREADIVSMHVPLQNDTHHYINKKFIDDMAKGFVLINTSRGIVTDTQALWYGLETGKIKGACLDVWEQEPIDKMGNDMRNLLAKISCLPQVIVTPHIAGYSVEALYKMSKVLLYKIMNY
ncbi:MAG: NAD(P)-dependent oxidoreductase [Flavipsychrobacter sp.]|nr:NAD(P)-dependent oxidoreductase [Flavipsychrobacter sp.]